MYVIIFCGRVIVMKKKQLVCSIIFLFFLTIVMVMIITPSSYLFGSNTDWLSQHVNLADYLRHTMIENKTLFPDFAFNIGAGVNIYNLSYYGLFRPDVLIGCLIPSVAMKDIIIIYMVINLILSVNLLYIWLKSKNFNNGLCIIGAILLLCSSVLFHSHRQIMFVDYMPWLIMALIAIDRYLKNSRSLMLIIAIVLMIANSYFFSVAGIVVVFSYYCYCVKKINLKNIWAFIKPVMIGILICSVLLLPTAYVMLENHQSKGSSINFLSLFIPRLNMKGLLYDNYGCGLTYLSWIGLVLSLKLKEIRKLSIWLLLLIFIPVFCFGLNGFLYSRPKILIPFIPLLIYVTIYSLSKFEELMIKIDYRLWILILLPVVIFYQKPLVIFDIVFAIFSVCLYLRFNKKALYLMMIMPLVLSFNINRQEEFVSSDTYQQVSSINGIKVDNGTRYDIFKQSLNTSNLANNNELRTSIYSSVNNSLYNHFYYDIINNPISIRNRVASLSNSNIFFQGMMGVKTIYSEEIVPIGYQKIGNNLYENNDVLPIIYATSDTYSEEKFDELAFPATLDTIYNNVVVANGDNQYQSQIKELKLDYLINKQSSNLHITALKSGYRVNTKGKGVLQLDLNQNFENQIMIIEFDIDKVKYLKTRDTSITINGIKNKLSSTSAAYPNGNNHFTYVISQNEPLSDLQIEFSSGRYDVLNIKLYSLDYNVIKNRNSQIDKLNGVYNQDGKIVKGSIDVSKDGYLVTSLPYQNGYIITIDGKKVDSFCVNKAFLGSKISSGKHQIEITFKAPAKNISLFGSVIGLVLLLLHGRRERNEERFKRIN